MHTHHITPPLPPCILIILFSLIKSCFNCGFTCLFTHQSMTAHLTNVTESRSVYYCSLIVSGFNHICFPWKTVSLIRDRQILVFLLCPQLHTRLSNIVNNKYLLLSLSEIAAPIPSERFCVIVLVGHMDSLTLTSPCDTR